MSTNFYLYDRAGIDAGVSTDRLVRVHVAKRHAGGVYTVQAVVNGDWDRRWDHFRETPYWSPVWDFPAIKSWADWEALLTGDETWVLLDEYGTVVDVAEFISEVTGQANPARAHADFREWVTEHGGAYPESALRGHYTDDEGYSMCSSEFT